MLTRRHIPPEKMLRDGDTGARRQNSVTTVTRLVTLRKACCRGLKAERTQARLIRLYNT